jgi:polyisoprenoid-binding protein YceI
MEIQNFKIVNSQSSINWIGKKVTGAHDGTIAFKNGNFIFHDGKLASGNVIVDTTSIVSVDVTDPATNAQFIGHLASDDFFSIEKFPTASLEITKATEKAGNNYLIEGNLTIKNITHPIQFNLEVTTTRDMLHAMGKIIIDRTRYDMKFRSGNFFTNLGDTLIYNEFELNVNIIAEIA